MTQRTEKPLRVLILTYIYTNGDPRYGGEGRAVWESTLALARAGVKVYVVTSMKRLNEAPHPNITVYKIPFAKKDFLNFDPGELLKIFLFSIPLLFIRRIDVIHQLPTCGPNPFARFKFGRPFAESADPVWDYANPKFGEELKQDRARKMNEAGLAEKKLPVDFWRRAARRFFRMTGTDDLYPRGTDVFFARTMGLVEKLKRERSKSLILYVPNGVDTKTFSPDNPPLFERNGNSIRFLHMGSVSRRKGTPHLIEAFKIIVERHPESELIIAGRGEPALMDELKKMAANYPQITFHENVSDEELPRVYTSADVFCIPSLGGPMLTVTSEAFASGLPVIATEESGNAEIVRHFDAGYIAEPGDSQNLAETMLHAIEHPEERETKAKNALEASQSFSWDNLASRFVDGYRQALGRRNKDRPTAAGRQISDPDL